MLIYCVGCGSLTTYYPPQTRLKVALIHKYSKGKRGSWQIQETLRQLQEWIIMEGVTGLSALMLLKEL